MATKRIKPEKRSALKAEQKVAFALLLFLGFGGAYFGFRSFGANLYRPIEMQFAKYYTGEDVLSLSGDDDAQFEELKNKDTDLDGIVDYDELYVYKTSPYLADSDSDGFDDKMEIFSGNDPNCPEGVVCGSSVNTKKVEIEADSNNENLVTEAAATGDLQFETTDEIKDFFGQASIEDIRAALIDSGLSAEQVTQIDDDVLKQMFNQAIEETATTGEFDSLITEDKTLSE
jgi:hypothetical protein